MKRQLVIGVVAVAVGMLAYWRRSSSRCDVNAQVLRRDQDGWDVFEITTDRDITDVTLSCDCAELVEQRPRQVVVRVDYRAAPRIVVAEVDLHGVWGTTTLVLPRKNASH